MSDDLSPNELMRIAIAAHVDVFLQCGGKIEQVEQGDSGESFDAKRTRGKMRDDLRGASFREMERRKHTKR